MNKMKLFAMDCVLCDSSIIFATKDMNLVFSLDINNGNITLIGSIPSEIRAYSECIGSIELVGKTLVVTPISDNHIWMYNLAEGTWKSIEIKRIDGINGGYGSIRQIHKIGEFVYLIGSSYPAIIKLDIRKFEIVEYIEAPFVSKIDRKDALFRSHGVRLDDMLYLASCCDNTVLKYNLRTDEFKWFEVGDESFRYSGITYDGEDFWLAPRTNGPIVRWDGLKSYSTFDLPEQLNDDNENYFFGIYYDKENIILPNMINENSIVIDKKNLKISILPKRYSLMKQINTDTAISESYDGILSINRNGNIIDLPLLIDWDEIVKYFLNKGMILINNQRITYENEICGLYSFIKQIVQE